LIGVSGRCCAIFCFATWFARHASSRW
jgi:hypothetical protein